jgi:hypothetical protein
MTDTCTCGDVITKGGSRCDRCEALHVLGLEYGANDDEIKNAFRILAKVWHPDRFENDKMLRTIAEDKLKEFNSAFQLLSMSSSRRVPPSPSHGRSPSRPRPPEPQTEQPQPKPQEQKPRAEGQPDASLAYPNETVLNPRLFLRNAGQNKLQVSTVIHWRSQNGEGTYNYPPLSLKSNEVSVIDLGLLQDRSAIPANANWSNVTLSYTGKSADLVPVAVSYDSNQRYGLQSPFTEGTNRMFKGGMWHVDSTHNTLITTGNGGSEQTAAQVTLFYNGGQGHYRIEKLLVPGEQLLLDVGQLIRNQIPDSDRNVIPTETMTGSYELRDLDHPAVGLLYEGKLTIDKTYGHGSYGCGSCCGLYNPKLDPNPFSGPPSFDNQDSYLAEEQCTGYWDDFTRSAYSWQSTNTAVATLPTSMLHTVAVGTATGSALNLLQATHPAPRCPQTVMQGNQPVNVEIPDHLEVLSDTQQTVNCSPNPSSLSRIIIYRVDDATGARIQFPFSMRENVPTDIVSSCNGGVVQTGANCTLNTLYYPYLTGEFADGLSPGCPNSPTNTPCGFQFTNQQWQWCPIGGQPTSMGTIGADNVQNTIINVDGNILGFAPGTKFWK